MKSLSTVTLNPQSAIVNGKSIPFDSLTGLYRLIIGDYPKFFKMDGLCKVGVLAAELCLKKLSATDKATTAVILFNHGGSFAADRAYQQTIADTADYFPSPSLFVYTLANIVTGEIAIRHKIYGETSFYIMPRKDDALIEKTVSDSLLTSSPSHILYGWVEYINKNDYLAQLTLTKI